MGYNCCLDERKMELEYDCIQYDGNSYWVMPGYLVFFLLREEPGACKDLALWLTSLHSYGIRKKLQ